MLAGGFNPATRAHVALAEAAARVVDEVLCVVPKIYPHKPFHGATLEERIAMLRAASGDPARFGIGVSEGGLFADIAEECREAFGEDVEVQFVCGRDAAERIVTWDYGSPEAIERMMERFSLLVADRGGEWVPPPSLAHRIAPLRLAGPFDDVSSTEVRLRIASGERWMHLVPDAIVDQVAAIYRRDREVSE